MTLATIASVEARLPVQAQQILRQVSWMCPPGGTKFPGAGMKEWERGTARGQVTPEASSPCFQAWY